MIREKPDVLTAVIVPGEHHCGWQLQWYFGESVVSFGTAENPEAALKQAMRKRFEILSAKAKGT